MSTNGSTAVGQGEWPARMEDVTQLEEVLSRPTPAARSGLTTLDSDLLILGVGGKMGPSLARMAVRALAELGLPYRVYGVARFSRPGLRAELEAAGVHTIPCDLLDRAALRWLPDSRNLIFMAGQKFGTTGNQPMTWALNSFLPGLVCERYAEARIVAFSTGNVYPLTTVTLGGSRESDTPQPIGEYANSCLARERIFEYFAATGALRCALMRLNYAVEMRYGVLLDIARKVYAGQPVDVTMGAANVIWQGDANGQALGLLAHCATPAFVCNVTGPETLSVRRVAEQFAGLFGVEAILTGSEAPTALLNNAGQAQALFGYPSVALDRLIGWTGDWVRRDGPTLDKPTHFETRDGNF